MRHAEAARLDKIPGTEYGYCVGKESTHMGIRDLRHAQGMTQRQIGDIAGISPKRIGDYETGYIPTKNMTLETAIRLGDALHVHDLRQLLEPDTTPPGRHKKNQK
jgi:transcriptional regulator with XRE-family HTH domain